MDQLSRIRFREEVRLALSDELTEIARLGGAVKRLEVRTGMRTRPMPPPAARRAEVVRLQEQEGLTIAEIAEQLDVSTATVKNDLRRARDRNGDRPAA